MNWLGDSVSNVCNTFKLVTNKKQKQFFRIYLKTMKARIKFRKWEIRLIDICGILLFTIFKRNKVGVFAFNNYFFVGVNWNEVS